MVDEDGSFYGSAWDYKITEAITVSVQNCSSTSSMTSMVCQSDDLEATTFNVRVPTVSKLIS